jgi:uncharacterized protein with HEPN domain
MSRDTQALLDMRESAQLAVRYLAEKSIDDFLEDVQLQDSVIRRLELIGEAARRVSESTRQTLAEISWNEINGMRNRLIHQYDDIDLNIVWETVQNLLPLIQVLEGVLPLEP